MKKVCALTPIALFHPFPLLFSPLSFSHFASSILPQIPAKALEPSLEPWPPDSFRAPKLGFFSPRSCSGLLRPFPSASRVCAVDGSWTVLPLGRPPEFLGIGRISLQAAPCWRSVRHSSLGCGSIGHWGGVEFICFATDLV